jgi:hypothetical protein
MAGKVGIPFDEEGKKTLSVVTVMETSLLERAP